MINRLEGISQRIDGIADSFTAGSGPGSDSSSRRLQRSISTVSQVSVIDSRTTLLQQSVIDVLSQQLSETTLESSASTASQEPEQHTQDHELHQRRLEQQ